MSGNVPFRAVHVDDLSRQRRRSSTCVSQQRPIRFDEGSLQLSNDPGCAIYRRLSEALTKQASPIHHGKEEAEAAETLKHLKKYGADLVAFMTDKDGRLKEKFEKVFIT